MDQAHARALVALQPFLLIATTTKSPSHRFLADNISRATSAPGTFVFTELLQTPAVQSLRSADTPAEYRSWLTHLEIFSYGTYQEYQGRKGHPVEKKIHFIALTDHQIPPIFPLSMNHRLPSSANSPYSHSPPLRPLHSPTPIFSKPFHYPMPLH